MYNIIKVAALNFYSIYMPFCKGLEFTKVQNTCQKKCKKQELSLKRINSHQHCVVTTKQDITHVVVIHTGLANVSFK